MLNLGDTAPGFTLPGVDGRAHSLDADGGSCATVVIFSCNHCPYVHAYEGRMMAIQRDYAPKRVQLIAINSNEVEQHPEDRFEEMVARSTRLGFNFPYLRDDDQAVARAYDAECTPQLFVFDAARKLAYTGRIDDNWKDPRAVTSNDLRNALDDLVAGRAVRTPSTHAIGCSIKWMR